MTISIQFFIERRPPLMLIVIGLAVIIAFAVVAALIDPVEGRQSSHDPRNDLPFWAFLGRR
jgi:hypothetical protein